ncbi:MAG: ABC transporter ATP-binding protein [Arenicellales bacterium]|nr:ABC transporter ATP-binding protein [Arenicellales bacterium]
MRANPPLLEMHGIDKHFGSVHANKSVDLQLFRGEVLGLLGENGAGKTTLMNILFGMYTADAGTISIEGRTISNHTPADALALGIGMVHQHFHLVPRHSVLENLMVGEPGRNGRLNKTKAQERLERIGKHYGLELEPEREVSELTVGEQQRLEIVKALFRGAKILILDEPTSVLTPQQIEGLFQAVRAMVADGVGVIFISHKLQEVLSIVDRVAVMRRGEMVATVTNDPSVTHLRLAELMCGRELQPLTKPAAEHGRNLLHLENVTVDGERGHLAKLRGVNLDVHAGEVVGVAGVSGNGQRELAEVIAGVLTPSSGRIEVDSIPLDRASPRTMQQHGISYIPEDRIGDGLLTTLPLSDSMVLPRVHQSPFSQLGWMNAQAIRQFVEEQIKKFDIRGADVSIRTGMLSGGNLQKALLARELAFNPLVLVASQPTRGLDVAAVEFVHNQFLELRSDGRGVLLISEDLEELFALSDRIIVMYEGSIVGDVETTKTTPAAIGLLMAGSTEAA